MPGVKGSGGPVPKRSDQRRRVNKTAGEERIGGATIADAIPCDAPPAGEWAHGIRQWYNSLGSSGQSVFYSASDWASAWLMAEAMNAELSAEGTIKSSTLAAWLKLCSSMLVTEGDRRRAALELRVDEPEQESPAAVTDMRSWREGLG